MLKDTEEHLYGREDQTSPQKPTTLPTKEAPHTWEQIDTTRIESSHTMPTQSAPTPKRRTGALKKIVLWIFVLAVIGGGVATYLANFFSTRALAVHMMIPDNVPAGKPFTIDFIYNNNTHVALRNAQVSLDLPGGVFFADDPNRTRIEQIITLGDISAKKTGDVSFSVIALGEQNSIKEFKTTLDYGLDGLRNRFEKQTLAQATIGEPALNVDLVLPSKIQAGGQFNFEIHYQNTLDTPLENAWVKMDSPLGFSATLTRPVFTATNFWKLGEIKPQESGTIFVSGSSMGQGGDVMRFGITGGITLKNVDINIARKEEQTVIAQAPFMLAVAPEIPAGDPVKPGDSLRYKLTYKNTSGITLNDVIIRAALTGSMFQLDNVSTDGFFDPNTRTITWTAAQIPSLKTLNPNDEGSIEFGVSVARDYPITSANDKNLTLRVDAQIDSPSIPANLQVQQSAGKAYTESKIEGSIMIEPAAFFRDAASGFVNSGPFPPRVDTATNYTIHWNIKNYAVDSSNVEVRSTLPQNAIFTGKVTGNYGPHAPQYNSRTHEIVWDIPFVEANSGVVAPSYNAIFQVAMTPTIFNKGSSALLLDRTTITATDTFTNASLSNVGKELTTLLPDDTTVGANEGVVQ
ncbi:MAG: hypothetical protein KGI50_03940 [Patescibacteria group bacterium]|nr:hypothetical protein [Patescibacteria group bacterium]MDE2438839.1 hypothetical protein [Patescibacteria group bacterium]